MDEAVIGSGRVCVCGSASVVESGEDTRGSSFFDEIAYNLVVKVLDRRPFDLFSNVLLLFSLQRELDEDLLQLLVNVVDA